MCPSVTTSSVIVVRIKYCFRDDICTNVEIYSGMNKSVLDRWCLKLGWCCKISDGCLLDRRRGKGRIKCTVGAYWPPSPSPLHVAPKGRWTATHRGGKSSILVREVHYSSGWWHCSRNYMSKLENVDIHFRWPGIWRQHGTGRADTQV